MENNLKPRARDVTDQLRGLILNRILRPGEPLRQEALSARLGISRTPLRQALQHLEEEGLVRHDDFRGARVAEIDAALIDDLFDMRLALEPVAMGSAFKFLTKIDLAKAEMALDEASETTDPARLSNLNWEFHSALYAPSGRTLLLDTIKRLSRTSALAEVIAFSITNRIQHSQDEHLAILAACRADDLEAACKLLTDHLSAAHQDACAALMEN